MEKSSTRTATRQRLIYIAVDYIMVSLSFLCINFCRYNLIHRTHRYFHSFANFLASDVLLWEQLFIPFLYLAVFWLSGFYNKPLHKSRVSELSTTFLSLLASTIIIYFGLLINDSTGTRQGDYILILAIFAISMLFVYSGRLVVTTIAARAMRHVPEEKAIIVGNSPRSRKTLEMLSNARVGQRLQVIGFVPLEGEQPAPTDSARIIPLDQLTQVCRQEKIDQIILSPQRNDDTLIMGLLGMLFPLNIPVKITPDTLQFVTANVRLNDILGIPLMDLTTPNSSQFQQNLKRSIDVIVSFISLIILSPLFLTTAIAVKLSSPGPVIYRQERLGRSGLPFNILKFRSMTTDAEKDGPRLSSSSDSRITPFGRFMRKYRIDEIPQFWNVLKGEMSLVGPRPERRFFVNQIVEQAPYYTLLFQVRPGITSWGMVKYGYASNVSQMVDRSHFDLIYLNSMSLSTDLKIICYTFRTVILGSGM